MKKKNLPLSIISIFILLTITQSSMAQGCSQNGCKPYHMCICDSTGKHCRCVRYFQPRLAASVEGDVMDIYPNPVVYSSTITFWLEQPQKISIQLYDMSARLVKCLANASLVEGQHQIEWNAADVNAGVYFLQFQSGDVSEMQKIIVTK